MGENSGIIEQYAAHLEAKATRLVIRSTMLVGFLGAVLGGFPLLYTKYAVVPSHLGFATLLLGAGAGAYLGYTMGERKAIEVRMQAQLALHQLQVEQSLMRGVARPQAPVAQAPVAPAPAPAPVVQQPAPAPLVQQPVPVAAPVAQPVPAPVAQPAPALVAPAPVAPPPVVPVSPVVAPAAPAPVAPAPVAPAPAPAPLAPPPVTPAASLPRLVEPQQMPPLSSAG